MKLHDINIFVSCEYGEILFKTIGNKFILWCKYCGRFYKIKNLDWVNGKCEVEELNVYTESDRRKNNRTN